MKLNFDMSGVDWIPMEAGSDTQARHGDGRIVRATHAGVWNFMDETLRVYRLEDGRTVIHADDCERLFARLLGP